jgi:formylglycine-generating enzyme required for sulfatase activity
MPMALVVIGVIALFLFKTSKPPSNQTTLTLANITLNTTTATPTEIPPTQPSRSVTPIKTFTPTPISGSEAIASKDRATLIYIPAGNFTMGSAISDAEADTDEKPQRAVYLDSFWIDKTEVTNAMFAQFAQATGYKTDAEREGWGYGYRPYSNEWTQLSSANWRTPHGLNAPTENLDKHPVVQVSWNDAAAYCQWAGRRLPTEAEWEKAARGNTDTRIFPWGNAPAANHLLNLADSNVNRSWSLYYLNDGYAFTAPVGSYPSGASPYGVLDMAGNVWEWTNDWYDENYYSRSSTNNPQGSNSGTRKAMRGGSWNSNDLFSRVTRRIAEVTSYRDDNDGFRCAASSLNEAEIAALPSSPTRIAAPTFTPTQFIALPTTVRVPTATIAPALSGGYPVSDPSTCNFSGRWLTTVWPPHRFALGCPTSDEINVDAAFQKFSNGLMIWESHTQRIYVLYSTGSSGSLSWYQDASPQGYRSGMPRMQNGFGYLWDTQAPARNGLVAPTSAESNTKNFAIRYFQGGVILWFDQLGNYALEFNNYRWQLH